MISAHLVITNMRWKYRALGSFKTVPFTTGNRISSAHSVWFDCMWFESLAFVVWQSLRPDTVEQTARTDQTAVVPHLCQSCATVWHLSPLAHLWTICATSAMSCPRVSLVSPATAYPSAVPAVISGPLVPNLVANGGVNLFRVYNPSFNSPNIDYRFINYPQKQSENKLKEPKVKSRLTFSGNNNEAQAFLSRGGQVIVRMRGLPYDCTAQQVVSIAFNHFLFILMWHQLINTEQFSIISHHLIGCVVCKK